MTLRPLIAALAAVATLAALPATASDSHRLDPAAEAQARAALTAEGYEVRKIEAEDGMIEAYAVKDGKAYELYLDAAGTIVRIKQKF